MFKYASIFQELLFIIINISETYNIYSMMISGGIEVNLFA